jgi:hypothetical protein
MADAGEDISSQNKGGFPVMMLGAVVAVALLAGAGVWYIQQAPDVEVEKIAAEYQVADKMYQLKDGSYLKLGFSIVVDEDKVQQVTDLLEQKQPGRLPAGITMILGNKTREDLINGTHKREAFARELKKMVEDRVFGEYNRKQSSSRDTVDIREILISDFVTQG